MATPEFHLGSRKSEVESSRLKGVGGDSIATELRREQPELRAASTIEGTLSFMSLRLRGTCVGLTG